ncbi:prolyl oligopeptidase family serine peptidase [Vulcanococcus limneticus]|uniref:S9 family peptidase n=1 Tax=Vulcanococcus limneticus TaxID=2170428 RepID=UPI00398BD19D
MPDPTSPSAAPHPVAPLPAAAVVGRTPSLKEPQLLGGFLYWQEQRPQEKGRTTLQRRRAGAPVDAAAEELTPGDWNLRSRVHGYGGGACALGRLAAEPETGAERTDATIAVFVHDGDRCLWALDLAPDGAAGAPRRLTEPRTDDAAFGGGLIDGPRRRWIGVLELEGRDQLVAVPLAGGQPEPLHAAADFCGYPALSPSGTHLAWLEWQQPWMPWQRSQLWLARLGAGGALERPELVAGAGSAQGEALSVFQPLWIETDGAAALVVANDRSGWWNLECLAGAEARGATGGDASEAPGASGASADAASPGPAWRPMLPMPADFAMPQWVFGMATHAWDGRQLLAIACQEGRWQLGRIALDPSTEREQPGPATIQAAPDTPPTRWQPIPIPFDDLAYLTAENGRLACVASGPTSPPGLLELELTTGAWTHTPAAAAPLAPEAISQPQPLWFPGHGDRPTHAWFYPPAGGANPQAPLLVKGHSGPTAMARTGLNPAIQFWTSRGWGVVDVNYGGSTGFGRAYRERLDGQWGVVDVADCAAAARALVEAGRAAAGRIAIEGGSAAGFTVLAALCFTDVFRAGGCRYAVTDLAALAQHDEHRFEARYLDGLVGPWPAAAATYAERSPLQHAERIQAPVIFFQGLEDTVVPPEQTERMAEALRRNGVPVEVHLFAEEGHGFRSSATQIQVLEATEAFFRRHFQL